MADTCRTRTGRCGAFLLAALRRGAPRRDARRVRRVGEDGGGSACRLLGRRGQRGHDTDADREERRRLHRVRQPGLQGARAAQKDGALVIDTHAVKLTLSPAGTDKLTFELCGETFKTPKTTALKRVSETQYDDAAVSLGLTSIRNGLAKWKAGGGKTYPPAPEVSPAGALGQMMAWPNNLFTGQPMGPGTSKGDYIYKRLDGGKSYSLVAYLSDGTTIGK